jgi:hypothetical protein
VVCQSSTRAILAAGLRPGSYGSLLICIAQRLVPGRLERT